MCLIHIVITFKYIYAKLYSNTLPAAHKWEGGPSGDRYRGRWINSATFLALKYILASKHLG